MKKIVQWIFVVLGTIGAAIFFLFTFRWWSWFSDRRRYKR
jgi:uncharacterized protein (DUF2062 family)